jgi:hypothetical protein
LGNDTTLRGVGTSRRQTIAEWALPAPGERGSDDSVAEFRALLVRLVGGLADWHTAASTLADGAAGRCLVEPLPLWPPEGSHPRTTGPAHSSSIDDVRTGW